MTYKRISLNTLNEIRTPTTITCESSSGFII